METLLINDQFGFRKGRGTREAILSLTLVLDKRLRKNKDTFIAFVDLEKAFDKVEWCQLFQMLRAGIKYRDRRVIWSLCREEVVVVRRCT